MHQIVSCSGLTGRGIEDGVYWLCSAIKMQIEQKQ